MSIIHYENSKSNQQKSCICTRTYSGRGSSCDNGGGPGSYCSIATRCCSEECSPAASNATLLHSGGFRRIARSPQFASGCETVDLPARHIDRSARARAGRSDGPSGQAAQSRWSVTAVQPPVEPEAEYPRSVADLRGLVKSRQLQRLRLPGEPAGPEWGGWTEQLRRNHQSRLWRV